MNRIKHSKFKNTGILFELLTHQITSDTLNNRDSKATKIIREHFKKGSMLNKELALYRSLASEKFNTESKANDFLDAVLESRKQINSTVLRKQKYNLIKSIKEEFIIDDFFRSSIQNYKVLASIYKLFESVHIKDQVDPTDLVKSKFTLVEHITHKPATIVKESKDENKLIEYYKKQNKDIRLLSYKLLVENFNDKYSGTLTEGQKVLLRKYIYNVDNSPVLKEHINKEVANIKKDIKKVSANIDNKVVNIKINEVTNQLDKLIDKKNIKDNDITALMRYYSLIQELKKVNK